MGFRETLAGAQEAVETASDELLPEDLVPYSFAAAAFR